MQPLPGVSTTNHQLQRNEQQADLFKKIIYLQLFYQAVLIILKTYGRTLYLKINTFKVSL